MISKGNHTMGILEHKLPQPCRQTTPNDDVDNDDDIDDDAHVDDVAGVGVVTTATTTTTITTTCTAVDASDDTSALPPTIASSRKCAPRQMMCDTSKKKLQLSFSVDRLLSDERFNARDNNKRPHVEQTAATAATTTAATTTMQQTAGTCHSHDSCSQLHEVNESKLMKANECSVQKTFYDDVTHYGGNGVCHHPSLGYQDVPAVIRPKPLRAMVAATAASKCDDSVSLKLSTLAKYHHHEIQPPGHGYVAHDPQQQQQQRHIVAPTLIAGYFPTKVSMDVHGISNLSLGCSGRVTAQHQQPQFHTNAMMHMPLGYDTAASMTSSYNSKNNNNNSSITTTNASGKQAAASLNINSSSAGGKRKRSWSRAVFSNLQRKGLEIQFQQQKYITKPDRRKLAARLNLTDAQVKVWFQNRRMKWRHTRENLKSGQEKQMPHVDVKSVAASEQLGYTSDSSSSLCASENEEDNEIDVTG